MFLVVPHTILHVAKEHNMVFISSTKVKSKLKITAHNASTEFGFSVSTLIQKLEELHTTIILMINVTIMETMNHS